MLAFLSALLFVIALLVTLAVLGRAWRQDGARIAAVLRGRGMAQPAPAARRPVDGRLGAVRSPRVTGRLARPALLRDAA